MQIHVQDEADDVIAYDAVEGWSLMEVLKDHGLSLKAECGGACCCATCHVYIDDAWFDRLADMSEEEEDMLDSAPDVRDTSRLSCQIVLDDNMDGLTLKIAKSG